MKIFDDFIVSIGFHAVGKSETGYKEIDDLFLNECDFEFYIKILKENSYKTINFKELSDWFEGKTNFNFKPIIITFDDGYGSVLKAAEIMKSYGFIGNVFIITDYIGNKSDGFPWEHKNPKILEMLNTDDIKALLREGWEIGSHTVSHKLLSNLTKEEIEEELVKSKKILEDLFETKITAFAYPKGKLFDGISSDSISIVSKFYKIGFSAESGVIFKDDNRFLLKRAILNKYSKKEDFLKKLSYNFLKDIGKVPEPRYIKYYNIGSELQREGDIKNSEKIFENLLNLYPPSNNIDLISGVMFHLGEINILKSNKEKAKYYFKKAYFLNSHNKAKEYLKRIK